MPQAAQRKDNLPPPNYPSASYEAEEDLVGGKPGAKRYPELDRRPVGSGGMVAIFLIAAAALAFLAYSYYGRDTGPATPATSTDVTTPSSSDGATSNPAPSATPPANPPADPAVEPAQPAPAPAAPADPAPPPVTNQTPATPPAGTQQ